MNHLSAGVGHLIIIRESHAVKLRGAVISFQYGRRILPGNGRARLYLSPAQVRTLALTDPPFSHQVKYAATALRIARIPVLHRAVLYVGTGLHHDFHHCCVKLVLIAHRRGTALHIAQGRALVGDDEGAFELARTTGVNPEVAGKVHRALHPLRDVAERAVGKDSAVKGGVEIVADRNHARQILAHQVRIFAHCLRE